MALPERVKSYVNYSPEDYGFGSEPDNFPILKALSDWKGLPERMAYYLSCSDFDNKASEELCTAQTITHLVSDRLRNPSMAAQAGISGIVYLAFTISAEGKITEVQVVKRVHPKLEAVAIRVSESVPPLVPAKQNGFPVSVRYMTGVVFKIAKR